jgi:hypothetical protein
LRTHIIIEQSLFELIDVGSGLTSQMLEANPDQDGASDMIALDARQARLTAINTGGLFGLAVKLLKLPTRATHLLRGLGRILSKIVGGDISLKFYCSQCG